MVVVTATEAVRGLPTGYQEGVANNAGLTMVLIYLSRVELLVTVVALWLFTGNYGITFLRCWVLCSMWE